MPKTIFFAGLALFVFGVSAFVGIIPLSGLNTTVTLSGLSVSCAPYAGAINTNACTGKVSALNTNSSSISGTMWMTVANQKNQQVAVGNAGNTGLSPSAIQIVSVGLGAIPIGFNYTLTAFFVNNKGWVVSQNAQINFNVGSVTVTIDDPGSQIGTTVPPPGTYTYQIGQSVTLTYTAIGGCAFQSWVDMLGGFTSTQNPLTFKPWRNFEFIVTQQTISCSTLGYTISPEALGSAGSINPSTKQTLLTGGSQTSVIFTATAGTNWYFIHWNLFILPVGATFGTTGQNVTSSLSSSSANPITITYASLSNIPVGSNLALQAVIVIGYPLVIGGNAGLTITPTPGSKYYAPGTTVTITATAVTGYCFQSWIVDGATNAANPLTLTMNGAHSVLPVVTQTVAGVSCSGPPPPSPPPVGGFGQIIGIVSMIGGGSLMFLGLRKRRR